MNTEAPDDALLSAYLDGELTADERLRVEAWLREHPESVAMLRTWSADMHAMRAALEGAADEPVPAALAQTVWRKGPAGIGAFGWSRWATAASAAAVFVSGGLIGAAVMWRMSRKTPEQARALALITRRCLAPAHRPARAGCTARPSRTASTCRRCAIRSRWRHRRST